MKVAFVFLCAVVCAVAEPDLPDDFSPRRDCVVLLHGVASGPLWLKKIEWALERRGYQVLSLSYPSTRLPVERLAREHVAPAVQRIELSPGGRIHFVTHSLGGLIVRQYLAENAPENLGRVVMLGPPNQGSELADWLKDNFVYRFFLGPSGQQLGTGTNDLPRRLGPVKFPLGVIAGDLSFNPFFSRMLPGRDDGKVSVDSARVEGMSDFVTVRSSHTFMIWHRPAIEQVQAFLETGRFHHKETASSE
jgi:triacylglycerol lipase